MAAAASAAAAKAPCARSEYIRYAPRKAVHVCAAAMRRAHFVPVSRAVAAMAEMQGEQVMIKKIKATADGALMAAVKSAP